MRTCVLVSCPDVLPPKSGNVTVETDGTVSVARFDCTIGYDVVGQAEITCGVDGTWSNSDPTCGKTVVNVCGITQTAQCNF